MTIQSHIPDKQTLLGRLKDVQMDFFETVQEELTEEFKKNQKRKFYKKLSLVIAFGPGVIIFLYVIMAGLHVSTIAMSAVVVAVLWIASSKVKDLSNNFDCMLDTLVYQHIAKILEIQHLTNHYIGQSGMGLIREIHNSNLLIGQTKSVTFNNVLLGRDELENCNLGQVSAQYHAQNSNYLHNFIYTAFVYLFKPSKNVVYRKYFHGYLLSVKLQKSLQNNIYITTKAESAKYGKRALLEKLFFKKSKELTEFEWNQFNQEFDVVASNPSEAREVLTPNLLIDFYNWNQNNRQAARISFVRDRFYCLLPYRSMELTSNLKSLHNDDLYEYLTNIAVPVWFLLMLTEDVRTSQ